MARLPLLVVLGSILGQCALAFVRPTQLPVSSSLVSQSQFPVSHKGVLHTISSIRQCIEGDVSGGQKVNHCHDV